MTATRLLLCVTLIALLGLPAFSVPFAPLVLQAPAPPAQPASTPLERLPLAFEPNAGQADPTAQFLVRAPGGLLFFGQDQVVLALNAGDGRDERHLLRWQFVDADPRARLTGDERRPAQVSYFEGNDPSRWQHGLPVYAGVSYAGLYPGIDLRYSGAAHTLKGTFVVAPGADPGRIRWRYSGARGGAVGPQGELQVELATGERVTEQAPVAWQETDGRQTPVAVRYALQAESTVGFAAGPYDPRLPLVIDPVLTYSSYLGGSGSDFIYRMAIDPEGNIYVTGPTYSADFPLRDPIQPIPHGSAEAFVSKLNPSGSALVFSTYLGGRWVDGGNGLAVDDAGNVYLAGVTSSPDFPVVNAIQPNWVGGEDCFVAQLDPSGTQLVYSTYLGGHADDGANSLVVDAVGRVYIGGDTFSTNFPTVNPFQSQLRGTVNAFIARLAPGGQTLEYSTYLGGSGTDGGLDLALDAQNNAYVTGSTESANFPLANPFQAVLRGQDDAFVSKLNAQGSALVYSTYLGGSDLDSGWGIQIDQGGQAWVAGATSSTDFPVVNPIQGNMHGFFDVFVTHFTTKGDTLQFSSYLGGTGGDRLYALVLDNHQNVYLSGFTDSQDYPLAGQPFQPAFGGNFDGYISKIYTYDGAMPPTPSATPTATPTATVTPVPPTPTATATPNIRSIYVPVVCYNAVQP
jgi:hypothetical protein